MEYQKKEIRIFQNGRTVNDQFYIDGDYNVPEAKRDVGKIILSNGMLRVEEMKQVESYLKVSGKLEFKVLYMADEMVPVPASLEGRIPFEEMIYLEQEPEGNLVLQNGHSRIFAIIRISCSWKLSLPRRCVRFWRDIFFPVCFSIFSASSLMVIPLRLRMILTCSPNVNSNILFLLIILTLPYSPRVLFYGFVNNFLS